MKTENKMILISLSVIFLMGIIGAAHNNLLSPSTNLTTKIPIVTTILGSGIYHTITVSGNGDSSVSPDQAQVSVGVMVQSSAAQDAATESAQVVSKIISQLQSIGVGGNNVSTTSYNIYPVYSYVGPSPSITGYSADYELEITLHNSSLSGLASQAARVIDTSVNAGANQVSGVQFSASSQLLQRVRDQALQSAISDAASRANVAASTLNVQIIGVENMTEEQTYSYPQPFMYNVAAATPAIAGVPTQIAPQNFTETDSVRITYLIE